MGSESESQQLKETPLASVHRALGARMVPFAGWTMPVQYSGVIAEHRAVRSSVGLFDVSHMGQLWIEGPNALSELQRLTTNDASLLAPGQAQYTFLTRESGGIVDDILVYCVSAQTYLLVVNASNIEKDRLWIDDNLRGGAEVVDRSAETGLLALQGPKAQSVLSKITDTSLLENMAPFHFRQIQVAGRDALVSRTGYTGEDGFELMFQANDSRYLWEALLDAGKQDGIVPAGLGARDTLRLEAKLCLYGNDIDEETTPIEAGLGFFVKFDKGDFIGREALLHQKEHGPKRRLVGFVMEAKGIPRQGYPICTEDGDQIGVVTSGTFAPTLEQEIGLGYVPTEQAQADTPLWIKVRTRRLRARIVRGRFLQARTST